jgi:hypothetical protein
VLREFSLAFGFGGSESNNFETIEDATIVMAKEITSAMIAEKPASIIARGTASLSLSKIAR